MPSRASRPTASSLGYRRWRRTLVPGLLLLLGLGCSSNHNLTGVDFTNDDPQVSSSDAANFIQATTAAIQSELDAVVTTPRSPAKIAAPDILEVMRPEIAENASRRNGLAEHGIAFTGYSMEMTVKNLRMSGSNVTATMSEHTILNVASSASGAPDKTEYVQEHSFKFEKVGSEWVMKGHTEVGGFRAQPLLEEDQRIPDGAPVTLAERGPLAGTRKVEPFSIQAYSLNRNGIADYALRYGIVPNSGYPYFDGHDCTNFGSQSLRAGGWTNVIGWYARTDVWWYNGDVSHTWINANKFFQFIGNRPRGYIAGHITQMQKGDIIQVDWNRDGVIDHTMVVTAVDGGGTPWVTYHSNNTRHRSFWDLYYADNNRNAKYYGWKLYPTFN